MTHIEGTPAIDYGYDSNGNITTENTWTYVYDLSNQLIRVLDGANQIAEYTFNGAGQRIKEVTQTETRIFHYDLLGHIIAETNQAGQMLAEYVYLGDQLLAMIKPGEAAYYFHNDHLGTPQVLTNESQTIAWKAAYTPFGEAVISVQTVENPFRFPGQYYDQETGVHYNYFRYYDPTTGRYVTPDPIGLVGGINLFRYTRNNPINFIDPLGLYESYWLFQVVPGQHFFDLGMTSLENRQYGWAATYFAGMLGEQVLFALTLGQTTAARGAATACEAGLASNAAKGAGKGFTTLYRAVGKAEYEQLMQTGRFAAGPNSLSGKFFAESAEHAAQWGKMLEGAGNFRVIETRVPTRVAEQLMRWGRLDGIGPARYGELEQLRDALIRGVHY